MRTIYKHKPVAEHVDYNAQDSEAVAVQDQLARAAENHERLAEEVAETLATIDGCLGELALR